MKMKPVTAVLFVFFLSFSVTAQVPSDFCQKLDKIIAEAANGTFNNFRGSRDSESKTERYNSLVSVLTRGYINSNAETGWHYSEFLSYYETDTQIWFDALSGCLPKSNWTVCDESVKDSKRWIFKNLKSRVFIEIGHPGVMLKVYLQKNSTAKCLWGNCNNGYGSYLFENNDVYTGDFIEGRQNGVGKYTWSADGESYDGYWLNGRKNGYGTYYDKNGKEIRQGLIYENTWVMEDVNKTPRFTKGETENGFGMVYDNGKYQICTHKDRLPSGMSLVCNENTVFGNYQNGFNGYCIFYFPNGTSHYGYFVNGQMKGKGTRYFNDETKFEGDYDGKNAVGNKFDKNDILLQKESWINGTLTVDNSPAAQSLVKFAKSLSLLCSSDRDKLRGTETSDEISISYNSTTVLQGAAYTRIEDDPGSFVYIISSKMNSRPLTKTVALSQYQSAIDKVRNCLSSVWTGKETENKDSGTEVFRNYTFSSNMYNYTIEVEAWFNDVFINIK